MTASASGFDPATLPPALRPRAVVVDQPPAPGAFAEAARFEEGQISGPFGPKFIGYGPAERPSMRSTILLAALIGALAGLVMLARAAFS